VSPVPHFSSVIAGSSYVAPPALDALWAAAGAAVAAVAQNATANAVQARERTERVIDTF
jgi:hypothetical protein